MNIKKQEYAIVDIETTGGFAGGSRITEIAIIIHDGTNILNRWESLVNPQKDIPLPIFALTGINNQLVANAPIFDEISEKVLELLTNRIFVAHNVNFDYSFVRHELEKSGFKWTAAKLCTVRATRKIKPGLASYSLGNLCQSLNIPVENRHRAGGDADATALLFSRLLEWDTENIIQKMIKKNNQNQRLPPNLPPKDFEQLPDKTGVYYFYNQDHKVIYVGKAVNIKKRVASHFSGHTISLQRQNFLRDIYSISHQVCATELMALLLECCEIKKLWPQYNRALKKFEPKYGLYQYLACNGYRYLSLGKLAKFQTHIEVFNSINEANAFLRDVSERFQIDSRFCKYNNANNGDFFEVKNTTVLPTIEQHNQQVEKALDFNKINKTSFAIIDKGTTPDEQSCIWIENGHFYGMGYFSTEMAIANVSDLKNTVTLYKSNHYIMQLITKYVKNNPTKVHSIQTECNNT